MVHYGPSARAKLDGLTSGMRVGLFGGSFNPVHQGHMHVAQTALVRLGLDRILWLVSPGNPLKGSQGAKNYAKRVQGVISALEGAKRQQVSEAERFLGTRYTLDTVRGFNSRWPQTRFVWIIGADNLAQFHRWRQWQSIAREIPIAVVSRPGDPVRALLSPFSRQFSKARLPEHMAGALIGREAPAWVYLCGQYHFASSTAVRDNSAMADKIKL